MPSLFPILLSIAAFSGDSIIDLDTLVVRAPKQQEKVIVAEREEISGRTDDLNNLLMLSPSVTSPLGRRSCLSVKGGTFYDNEQFLRGIPVLSLSHFSGRRIADISALSTAIPLDIDFFTRRFAGDRTGATGSVLDVNPVLPVWRDMPRPELRFHFGSLGVDCAFGLPVHPARQYYLMSIREIWPDRIWFENAVDPHVGFAQPSSSTDFQFLGTQRKHRVYADELIWVSREAYIGGFGLKDGKVLKVDEIPKVSGTGSISLRDSASLWQGVLGGGRQWLVEGIPLGQRVFGSMLRQDNSAFFYEIGNRELFGCKVSGRVSAQVAKWNGSIQRQKVYEYTPEGYVYNFLYQGTLIWADSGYSGNGACHLAVQKNRGKLSAGVNANGGIFLAGAKPFFDAGTWLSWYGRHIMLDLDAGRVCAQPDIRGMPASGYASRIAHLSQGDVSLRWLIQPSLSFTMNAFVKHRDRQPQKSKRADLPIWDPALDASLTSAGASITADAGGNGPVRAWSMAYYNYTFLNDTEGNHSETWNIPWTWRTFCTVSTLRRRLFFILVGEMAGGMAFPLLEQRPDTLLFWDRGLERGPISYELDGKVEYRNPIGRGERNVVQFDVYVEAKRIWSGFINNTGTIQPRDLPVYYLVNAPQAYNIGFDVALGARIHVRL